VEPLPAVRPRVTDIAHPVLIGAASVLMFGFAITTLWNDGQGPIAG
jgi:hypothetical protein